MQGIIKLDHIPETCMECPVHSYASGCGIKKKRHEGFKSFRASWCPIEIIGGDESENPEWKHNLWTSLKRQNERRSGCEREKI